MRKDDNRNENTNVVTDEIKDVLMLFVDSPINSWVLDSGTSFHTTVYRNLMKNYVARNYKKVYLAVEKPLNIIGMGDIRLKMSNISV